MKKHITAFFIMVSMSLAFIGCKDKAKEATTTEAETIIEEDLATEKYNVDTDASIIEWQGYKPAGSHNGTISIENGIISTSNGTIVGGSFSISMNSIKDSENNAKLEGHLKSGDFFEVEKYPSAAFEITGLEETDGKTMLSGNLTIKEINNNITFPVTITNNNDTLTLSSETFSIDRTKWDIKFKSKSFFDELEDKFINDDIAIKINVKADKL
ncbi:lipid-binding protein [Pseudalgibacter alginicilyticus]|uniref:Lipid-binding protein n=1 Tax=Pseudalgibacter alginicilyticus TaxID=1736674 RepID=A0A0P0CJ84_9FLAO|nr:YceI family protein [Pseudalgibacter alginicilyticus]ALJ04411.1 lipid-binding protein [Pseudalgibacter alginicilyticus]